VSDYQQFLINKFQTAKPIGFEVSESDINPKAFKFQNATIRWGLYLARAAYFQECGMGKSLQELEWARHVTQHTKRPVIILEPLAVAQQTVSEAGKFDIQADVQYARSQDEVGSAQIVVTNYERLHLFDPARFSGVVLDEASILKNLGGKTFWRLVRAFADTRFKLVATATPAPNDFVEFSNQSTFLGIMHFKEVLARWFMGDSKLARSAILKKHAEADFWRWLTSWAVCLSTPADLGPEYAMHGYDLPPLHLLEHRLSASQDTIDRAHREGMLLPDTNPNSTTLHKVKRESLKDRVHKALELVEALPTDAPCIVWCDTNYEADALMKALPQSIEVRGSHTLEQKEDRLNAFTMGKERLLITKPEIAGFGLNWQHCADMVFVGVSFSFEKTYQALRRSYRFGQTKPVNAHLIYAETEGSVLAILKAKQRAFAEQQQKMNAAMLEHGLFRSSKKPVLASAQGAKSIILPAWLKSYSELEEGLSA
jgi:hypothetical protein